MQSLSISLRLFITFFCAAIFAGALIVFVTPFSHAQEATTLLTIARVVINDDGGSYSPTSAFIQAYNPESPDDIVYSGNGATTTGEVPPGLYELLDDTSGMPDGYSSTWNCIGGVQIGNSVQINGEPEVTCIVVDDDIAPQLKLVKVVDNTTGGTATAHNWQLTATATTTTQRNFSDFGDSDAFHDVDASVVYTLSESGLPNYSAGSWDCGTTGHQVGNTVNLLPSEVVVCTITNTYAPGSGPTTGTLTLVKQVVNDDGGLADENDFQAQIDGDDVAWSSAIELAPGAHTASETNLPGYTAGSWGGDCASDGAVALLAGENKTCTITNDDVAVIKITPTVSVNNSPVVYSGAPQAAIVAGSVGGTVSDIKYDGSSAAPTDVGTYAVTTDFVPTDATNYNNLDDASAGDFTIEKTDPVCSVSGYTVIYDGFPHTATGSCLGISGETLAGLDLSGTTHNAISVYNDSWTFIDGIGNYNNDSGPVVDWIVYGFDGFLQPINDTAHQIGLALSVFKGGSTVPVKFQIKDANGNPIEAATLPIWVIPQMGSPMSSSVVESFYSEPATTGSLFKWDPVAQQYIYNWSTKGLQTGRWWRIYVVLDDGSVKSVTIGLK